MKVLSAAEAAGLIKDGVTLVSSGFRFAAAPEALLSAIGKRFRDTGSPKNLKLVYSAAQAGAHAGRGLDHLAHEGLLHTIIGGFYGSTAGLKDLIAKNKVIAYNLPQGQIALLYRAIAAGQAGIVTHVGLHTFVDPRIEGGRLTKRTKKDYVEIVKLGGKEWLHYPAFPLDVCVLRGTTADEDGNISLEKEAVRLEALPIAMAVKNSGGTVIVQVERIAKRNTLNPQRVEIPGHLVDVVVVCENPETDHQQALDEVFNPAYIGEAAGPVSRKRMEFSLRKVLARRAAKFLRPGMVVNLGQGMPEGVGAVADENGLSRELWTSLESGVIGGVPTDHANFGVASNPAAIIRHDDQFSFYNGGGVDLSVLGFAEIDKAGAINVSRFGTTFTGGGGFIDICARTKQLVFCGMFDAGGKVELENGRVKVLAPGKVRKLVDKVNQVTFSGHHAVEEGRGVSLVTERAVFQLTADGWVLEETAPGVRVKEDVLDHMGFKPIVGQVREMDASLFASDGK